MTIFVRFSFLVECIREIEQKERLHIIHCRLWKHVQLILSLTPNGGGSIYPPPSCESGRAGDLQRYLSLKVGTDKRENHQTLPPCHVT